MSKYDRRVTQARTARVIDLVDDCLALPRSASLTRELFTSKRVEPNSGLGGALRYILSRWDALTLFLRR